MPRGTWETEYPPGLTEQILRVVGPAYLCDEIMRDEDPRYVQLSMKYEILAYVNKSDFERRRILDFGCGCGASTMILARMFPGADIIGVDLEEGLLCVARLRARYHGFDRVSFLPSPGADTLPAGLDDFDYIVLNGVYEHLLPEERNTLLPRIWERLKPGGVLFIGETPHRYFPYESHTTSLPFINYVPDGLALHFARRFSKRVRFDETWESLLRRGIRGATVREIMRILKGTAWVPIFLEAEKLDVKDRIDLWYKISSPARLATLKRFMAFCMTGFRCITGVTLTPNLSLAISKGG